MRADGDESQGVRVTVARSTAYSRVGASVDGTDRPDVAGSSARILDARMLPVALALWIAEAAVLVVFGNSLSSLWLVAPAGALVVGFVMLRRAMGSAEPLPRRVAVSLVVAAVAGSAIAGLRLAPLTTDSVSTLGQSRSAGTAELVLSAPPRLSRENSSGPIWADSKQAARLNWTAPATLTAIVEGERRLELAVPVRLVGSSKDAQELDKLVPGTGLSGAASIRPGEPSRGTALLVRVRGSPSIVAAPPVWQRGAANVRASMRMAASGLSGDAKGLLPGLVVGDESGLSEELREQMRRTGLSHLTAVSGANLAIITGAVLAIAMAFRVPRRPAVLVAAAALLSFVVVVGPQPSVLRAAAMGGVALLALFTRRPSVGFSVLAVSVTLVLLVDPWMAVSMGFALSVCATAGLLIYAEHWRLHAAQHRAQARVEPIGMSDVRLRPIRAFRARLWGWAKVGLGVATAAQLATLPLIASFGDGLPVLGVAANLLAEPAVAFTTVVGCVAAGCGLVAPDVGVWVGSVAGVGAWWIASVAHVFSDLPGAVFPWPGELVGFALATVLVVGVVWAWLRRREVSAAVRENPRGCVAAGAAVLAVMVCWRATQPPWPPPGWAVAACDVGQGDALVIPTAPRRAVVIDVGPEPAAIDRCLSDLGVTAIDLLVLSHFHADHVAGIRGATLGRKVAAVLVSPLAEPADQRSEVMKALAEQQVEPRVAEPGEQGVIGAVRYTVWWPSAILRGSGSAPNNASVVLAVEVGDPAFRVLLTGDLEPPAQAAILAAQAQNREQFDVVKVPHHGSRNQSDTLAHTFPAAVALISVGADNTYGHPAPATVKQWRDVGAKVARTDELGDVVVGRDANGQVFLVGQGSR